MSASAFDRPVSHLLIAQNPWPFAQAAMEVGYEVMESDQVPDGQAFLVDLSAFDLRYAPKFLELKA